ncbi:LCP family protein [Treponema lecithinolyticum]|uniref:LCP family protein n=2 Tax=Treponema lecithinolyticum TaxID=53418 RepID=UPI0028ED03BC|nr:LCP family protein [Treponema lecithinolyticum]
MPKIEYRLGGMRKHIVFFALIVCVLTAAALILFFSLKTNPVEEALKNDQIIKLLFVLKNDDEALFTMLMAYYPVSHRGALIDIPGNTGAIYASLSSKDRQGRVDRIDAVYKERGIEVYRSEIEKMLGMNIPFTIEIDLDRFSELTDLLGGLRVFVPYPIDDVVDGVPYLLPSGSVMLDGDKIRTYMLYSDKDASNIDRQDRLQNAAVAFLSALNARRFDIFKKNVFPVYASRFRSNIKDEGLYSLLQQISKIDAERLFPQSVTGSLRTVDGKLLLFPYYDGQLIKDVLKQTVSALVSETEVVHSRIYVLAIQNGTPVQGLAKNTAALLQSAGYDILTTSNADKNDYEKTFIIDHIGNGEVAKNLGDFIRCSNIVTAEVKKDDDAPLEAATLVDFTVVLGRDFDGRYVR